MSRPAPHHEPYHSDLIAEAKGLAQREELGACAFCGRIEARSHFALRDLDVPGHTVLVCEGCQGRQDFIA